MTELFISLSNIRYSASGSVGTFSQRMQGGGCLNLEVEW